MKRDLKVAWAAACKELRPLAWAVVLVIIYLGAKAWLD